MDLPPLVSKALSAALSSGYIETTRSETGRFLAVLAAACTAPIAEIGTGSGVGAAWLRHGATDAVTVLTVEADDALAEVASAVFADDGIEVMHGDWEDVRPRGPFGLLAMDAAIAAQLPQPELIESLVPGGMLAIDDFGQFDGRHGLRSGLLENPGCVAAEVRIAEDCLIVLATRLP
ncbi:O-methyltransferase [Parenemella sanctibonifatiensis]|uniref:Cytidine deaminase n=1 Tax=Parenemella sanctibonifatiensis TaxID=2016505 RepID=A0A255EPH0_9ACTN|nr:class I SAM-dependent methyltransferase [Parenemella sanctibonifatiensis]OYN90033.1 cytidine deaminase [Parenemella sanctibonifatiensis]